MKTYLVAFGLAAFVTAITTPLLRYLVPKIGAIDLPNGRRVHKQTIPRMGGIAIIAGFFTPLVCLFFYDNSVSRVFTKDVGIVGGVLLGGVSVAALGTLDDLKGLKATVKFLVQVIIAIAAYYTGFKIEVVNLPLLAPMQMGVFALPITVLWIVTIINAMNLIDGLDGLAAGVALFACIVNFVVALVGGNSLVALLSASLAGGVFGFLFYNFNPATIFMGDVGSMFLGYIIGTTALLGSAAKASTAVSIAVPLLALGVPIMDTLFAIVRRYLERRPIFSPDRGHIHHRLVDIGLTQRRAVLLLYGLTALFTILAIVVYIGRNWMIGIALAIASVTVIGIVRSLGYFSFVRLRRDQQERRMSVLTDSLRRRLPNLIEAMKSTASHLEAKRLLQDFAVSNELLTIDCDCNTGDLPGKWFWENANINGNGNETTNHLKPRGYVSAKFPIQINGHVKGTLKFAWISDQGHVSPQNDILLQMVVDSYVARLADETSGTHAIQRLVRAEPRDRFRSDRRRL